MTLRPLTILRYLFTVVLFGLIFWSFRGDWRQGFHLFRGLDLRLFGLAIPMVAVHYVLKTWKWRMLLRRRGIPAGMGLAARSLLAGIALSLFTPMNLGELGRVLYLPGRSRSTLAGLVLVDKAIDLTAVFLFAVPGTLILFGGWWALIPASAALAALSILVLGPAAAGRLRRWYWLGPVRRRAVRVALAAARVGPGLGALLLLVALLAFFVVYVLYFVLLRGLVPDGGFRLGQVIAVVPLVMAGRLVPLTVSGLGVREWIAALLFPGIGVTEALAVEVTLLVFLLTSAIPALIGVLARPRDSRPAVRALVLLLLLLAPVPLAMATDLMPLVDGNKEGRIPAEYFPRFRNDEQVEQVVEGYRRWLAGDRDEALALFEAAAAADPESHQPLKLLAHAYMETGRHSEARAVLDRALEIFPHDSWLHRLLSRWYFLDGDLKAAIDSGKDAIRRSKEEVSHVTWLAGLCREAGRARKELKLSRKAVKMDPHDAALHERLAVLHRERGKPKKAYAEFAEAVRRDPSRCDLLVVLVEMSAELERPEEDLRRYLRDALRCDTAGLYSVRLEPYHHLAPPDLLPGEEDEPEDAGGAGKGE